MTGTARNDPRELFRRATSQLATLIGAVTPDQLADPTPCSEYDVRALLDHIVMGQRRIGFVADGSDFRDMPPTGPVDDGDWPRTYVQACRATERAWADDGRLTAMMTLPFGTLPGAAALAAYVEETATHSWDLAVATGQTDHLDPVLGEAALQIALRAVPAEPRGGPVPFGPVVPVPDDADPYARLAGYLGRTPGPADGQRRDTSERADRGIRPADVP